MTNIQNECKPVLQALPSPSVLCEIQPKWPKNCCRAQALAEEQQYTLSFGMDHSANTRSMGKRRLFSIEGSYYEDNLQSGFAASNPLESDYDLSISREDQHLNELYSPENDINRNKGQSYLP
uniref:FZ domain-containing protein n=1 Tax=Meloidogyne hapla TaxID=6305 RepID=A0A1I8BH96_MELHA